MQQLVRREFLISCRWVQSVRLPDSFRNVSTPDGRPAFCSNIIHVLRYCTVVCDTMFLCPVHRFCAPRLMYQDVHCNVCLVENHDERYNISRFLLDSSRNHLLCTKAVLAIFDKEKVRWAKFWQVAKRVSFFDNFPDDVCRRMWTRFDLVRLTNPSMPTSLGFVHICWGVRVRAQLLVIFTHSPGFNLRLQWHQQAVNWKS
jgi:hypothetical protein